MVCCAAMERRELPIFEIREQLLATLAKQRRLIITAPTGSGKSTQVPQMLLDGGLLGPTAPAFAEATARQAVSANLLVPWPRAPACSGGCERERVAPTISASAPIRVIRG